MQLYKLIIHKNKLDNIPENERVFFILAGHISNELNVLRKFIIYCSNLEPKMDHILNSQLTQSLIIIRVTIGKIYEAWRIIRKIFYGNNLSFYYEPLLNDAGKAALVNLKKYFKKSNLINIIRNQYSFHYNYENIAECIHKSIDDKDRIIYLSDIISNNLYAYCDSIINYAVLELCSPGHPETAINILMQETIKVGDWLIDFLTDCLIIMINKYFRNEDNKLLLEILNFDQLRSINEIEIPFFINEYHKD